MIDPLITARHLKGCPATILIALIFSGRAMNVKELRLATGYGRATTFDSLALLEPAGFVVRKGDNRFALHEAFTHFFQTKNSDFRPPTPPYTATTISPKTEGSSSKQKEASENREIAQMLIATGIGRRSPKLQAILDAGLDAAYVQAHVDARAAAIAAGEEYSVGLLITRLLDGDPAPVTDAYIDKMIALYGNVIVR